MSANWPFPDPPNVATMVTRYILEGETITHAYRDWDDGMWQFLPDRVTQISDGRLVCLEEIYKRDPSIAELADLPPGWMAERAKASAPWVRRKNHPFPVFADHGFYLEDATAYQQAFPDQYSIPDEATRENLRLGDIVKLGFRFAGETSERANNETERMWVEIVEADSENLRYRATLANDPMMHPQIAFGYELWFHPIHVFAISKD